MADPRDTVLTYRTATAKLRASLIARVRRLWGSLPDYRQADIDQFVRLVVPLVVGGQRQVAALTDAYLAQFDRDVTGRNTRPVGVPADVIENLRGVPMAKVYERPAHATWYALSQSVPFDEAVQRGLDRAVNLAVTDLQLAKTHTARHVLKRNRNIVGHRRILEGPHSCGLCIVASTQRYRKGDLLPMHPGCDCGIQPIYAKNDPGQIIEPERLEGIHERIQERFGVSDRGARAPLDYRDVLLTHDHGEIGPVLGVRGHDFKTG